ncbi:tetratricopeptide repeat protein [Bosea sp. BK604]|uniref:tetratricopeptide repeat protein n=1 Tax=Bosea sp. BK604 TaxID=2512180 RepID=UPI001042D668|nr:tetratricopeptide repeat protein [Bosea sp. BK604]TCR64183.1 Flp pilus assembly protein TadD [Bosea sp. BK604]
MTSIQSFPPITLRDRIASAHELIVGRRFDEAEALLDEVLQADPGHAEALNALGGVALARKDGARAGEILSAAATAFPDDAAIVNNLGLAHQMLGRLDEAIVCFERATALTPQADGPLHSLATARFMMNNLPGARMAAEQILARSPDAPEAVSLLGMVALAEGNKEQAELHLSRALALNPNDAAALRTLSICCYDRLRFDEALHLAERARLAAPLDMDIVEHLARCEAALGLYPQAEASCRKLLAFAPNHLGVRELLARVLVMTGRPDAGIAELTKLVKASPKSVEPLLGLAATLRFAGRLTQALPFVQHALKLDPDNASALDVRAELSLAIGRFLPRLESGGVQPEQVNVPPGMRAADFILFSRFLARLSEGGAPVRLGADERFWPLAAHLRVPIEIPPPDSEAPAVALPALMRRFDLDATTVAQSVPYLQPNPTLEQRWQQALSEYPRPWIGVVWENHASGLGMDQVRAAMPGRGTVISLMTGQARHDLAAWPEAIDAGRHMDGFDEMIGAIANLDAVIGPDVSALHLAGALGRPGFVVVSAGYPWYWAAQDGHSLWYPSIEVMPQEQPGQWSQVVADLHQRLSQRFADLRN